MASKAQLQMLMNMAPKNQQFNPNQKKKKKGNLSDAARRKLASMQAAQKKQGQKNGNN